ncbi:MAG: ABC transporter ATP-binding protein [Candidatus Coatesbacteria bacterium]|nr:MAG: ABC transporter ATP-binding protein [Candidatus Coatesbacteria bacterium]
MDNVVEIRDLHKVYRDGFDVHALRGVDLDVARGEFMTIAGPSGSGKTTLLNLLGGLDRPTEGRVFIEGQEVTAMSRSELADMRRRRLGFVFQSFNLIPVLTARENVEFALILRGVGAERRRALAQNVLEQVSLDEGMRERRPLDLSGGQQQRVAVARAIVGEPAVVLADEPTANLDTENALALLDLMERLNEERQATFIFSTHDPRVMERARRRVTLRDGEVVSDERVA